MDVDRVNSGEPELVAGKDAVLEILVAEDDIINMSLVSAIMERFGHHVEGAANGREAIQILGRHRFDLVFMDIQMPVMNGYEASRLIRAADPSACNPDIPIIAMTGYSSTEDICDCLDAGMDGHIVKPVRIENAREIVSRFMPQCLKTRESLESQLPNGDGVSGKAPVDLSRLHAIYDNEEDVKRTLWLFVKVAEPLLGTIRRAIDLRDEKGLAELTHRLIGSSGSVGAQEMISHTVRFEAAAKIGNWDDLGTFYQSMERSFEKVKQFVRS